MWPQFSNMLSPLQWLVLGGAVPTAIVLLYFLKLKRQPLEVPSTYLWRKSIEDLHVNSIWQRLRQSLLLFLQLLMLVLIMLALLRPSWQGSKLSGGRYIFLVDTSASMGATDLEPTRLDEAKRRVTELIDEMKSGDVAMLISFADAARVEQPFTDNRNDLRRRLSEIKQTDRATDLAEALRVASGLANPGRSANVEDIRDFQVAEAMPAILWIFSDGKFQDVKDFSLGHLDPRYVPIGRDEPRNISIATFSTSRHEEKPEQLQAFARLENHGLEDVDVEVVLKLNGELLDAQQLKLPAGEDGSLAFELGELETGVLELSSGVSDDLKIDDVAWTTVSRPRRSKVLLVTSGDEPLQLALETDRATELADLTIKEPGHLKTPEYAKAADSGAYDLVIYDRCQPPQMPQANTLFIGRLPVGPGTAVQPEQGPPADRTSVASLWKAGDKVNAPQVIDTDRAHPLMQLIDLGDVLIAEATPLFPPPGSSELIHSGAGSLFAVGPRDEFEDAVLGFEIIGDDRIGTNWPVRLSFPVFVLNVLDYLGGSRGASAAGSVRPGQPVVWRSETAGDRIRVTTPSRARLEIARGKLNTFHIGATSEVGVYDVQEKQADSGHFAVNLFDSAESDIRPRPEGAIQIGNTRVEGKTVWEPARRDLWKVLALAALAVLLFEWYIYNRRVYI